MYFVVVAARAEASLPPEEVALSLFTDLAEVELSRLDQQARELVRLDGLLQEKNRMLEARNERIAYLEEIAAHREAQRAEIASERDALSSQLTTTLAERDRARETVVTDAAERGRLEEQIAKQERVIAYRESASWWLALPWARLKLAWQRRSKS
jgi:septal ring factor EnvC (AmiA/AmiB activator)